MVNIIKYGNFKSLGKNKDKHQIILAHSYRKIDKYLLGLTYRFNGKNPKIPNYIVKKNGEILQLLSNEEHSIFFSDTKINKNSIIIVLENLGWLEKEPLKHHYVNWIGDIYNGIVFEKKWRDYFFWEPYSDEQMISTANLVKYLMKKTKIKNNIIGHNTKINGIENFEGVVTRSNFTINFTDVNPAFNFENFLNLIENETQI